MLLGGNLVRPTDIELMLDLSKSSSVCSKLPDFPMEHYKGAIGAYHDRKGRISKNDL